MTGLELAGLAEAAVVPPPGPDPIYIEYTGTPGVLEIIAVLAFTGAAAWVGVRTGLNKAEGRYVRGAGWVGGVGAGLIGALYLASKAGIGSGFIPAVRITPPV